MTKISRKVGWIKSLANIIIRWIKISLRWINSMNQLERWFNNSTYIIIFILNESIDIEWINSYRFMIQCSVFQIIKLISSNNQLSLSIEPIKTYNKFTDFNTDLFRPQLQTPNYSSNSHQIFHRDRTYDTLFLAFTLAPLYFPKLCTVN